MRAFLFIVFLTVANFGQSQTDTSRTVSTYDRLDYFDFDKTSIGIITGWHQFRYSMMEVGIGLASSEFGYHGNMFRAVSLSAEINPWRNVIGYKASVWKSIPMIPISLGLNGILYSQASETDWTIRPMLGVGYENIHFTYGYDIPIGKRDILERNSHSFSLRYFIPVIKLKK